MAVTSLYSTSLIGTLLENLSGYGINKTTGYFQGWVWNFHGDVSLFLHFHIILVDISSPAPPFFSLLCSLRKEVGTIERSNIKMPPGVRQVRKWTGVKPRGRVGAAKLDRMGDNVCPQSRGDSKFWKTLNSRTETHPGSFCSQPHSLKKLSGTFPRLQNQLSDTWEAARPAFPGFYRSVCLSSCFYATPIITPPAPAKSEAWFQFLKFQRRVGPALALGVSRVSEIGTWREITAHLLSGKGMWKDWGISGLTDVAWGLEKNVDWIHTFQELWEGEQVFSVPPNPQLTPSLVHHCLFHTVILRKVYGIAAFILLPQSNNCFWIV